MKQFYSMMLLASILAISGCANWNSVYREFNISEGKSPMVDIRQRAVIVAPNKKTVEKLDKDGKVIERTIFDRMFVCAEPSPDAMASLASELAMKGGVPEKAFGEVSLAMQDSAAFTGLRTQSIQLLRDFGYRLCESHLSGGINSQQYDLLMRRYQKNTVALLAIEQLTGAVRSSPVVLTSQGSAAIARSLTDLRASRENISKQLADLEKKKADALQADPKADTSKLTGEILSLDEDRDAIDKAISNSQEMLASGKTEITIKTDSLPAQRSDDHIQKVAEVVSEIVNNIILSDDTKQMCLIALQSAGDLQNSQQKAFADWCVKDMNNQADANKIYITSLEKIITDAGQKAAKGTPKEKKEASEKIDSSLKELRKKGEGTRTYMLDKTLQIGN